MFYKISAQDKNTISQYLTNSMLPCRDVMTIVQLLNGLEKIEEAKAEEVKEEK